MVVQLPIIKSTVDKHSDQFQRRSNEMHEEINRFRTLEKKVVAHSDRAKKKFDKRGQLLPRQRIERLLDRGSPFLELSTLAGCGMHDDDGDKTVAGGGNIIGVGRVNGVRCLVSANDSGIKGGSICPMGLKKTLRAQEIALQNKLPSVSLVESGGANLLHQAEIFVPGGRVFCNMARLSAAGIPQITVVHGSSTAGGAYMPGLSDYVVVVRDRAKIFLAGPPLVKAALQEVVEDDETLGGALLHAELTGTAEYLAEDDAHGIDMARDIVSRLNWGEDLPAEQPVAKPPRYDPEELLGIVPVDFTQPYDVREVIARIVDDSDFLEFKARFGPETVCGHASIMGHKIGLIGNNGPIFPAGANKAAHFIQACCQTGIPIVYLHNITGYMVGTAAEQAGIVKHGAKMIQAVSNATVPQLSVVIGGSFGAGNYGMCGRAFDPRFIFAWPNARISVMGGQQAATVMEIILMNQIGRKLKTMGLPVSNLDALADILKSNPSDWESKLKSAGLPIAAQGLQMLAMGLSSQVKKMGLSIDPTADRGVLAQLTDLIRNQFDRESTALFATAHLWDDGIIDPRDTRRVLGESLSICRDASFKQLRPNSFGVGRM